jgi:hypothetical protein
MIKKYKQKSLRPIFENYKFGFVILCPERNIAGLRNTRESIRHNYPHASVLCVVGNDVTPEELKKMEEICPTFVGEDTITSLINTGVKESVSDWNVLVFAGSWVKTSLYRQFDLFVKSEKDILFQVIEGRTNFIDGSMNGIVIHKKALELAGDFPRMQKMGWNELEMTKTFWAYAAIEQGFRFKAVMGMRVA